MIADANLPCKQYKQSTHKINLVGSQTTISSRIIIIMKATIAFAALLLICTLADAKDNNIRKAREPRPEKGRNKKVDRSLVLKKVRRKLEQPDVVDIPDAADPNTDNSGINGNFFENAATAAPCPGEGIDGQARGKAGKGPCV